MLGPTADHGEIRAWAERHNAQPAQMRPIIFDSEPAILHFIFGDAARDLEQLLVISWDAFFLQFALMELTMCYDESPTFELIQAGHVSIYRSSAEGLV